MALANLSIAELLKKDELELFAMLGEDVSQDREELPGRDELIQLGWQWWQDKKTTLASLVCGHSKIRELASTPTDQVDKAMLAALVADVILGAMTDVSPLVVSVIIARTGVRSFCPDAKG